MPTVGKSWSGKRIAHQKEVSLIEESRHQLDLRMTVGVLPGDVLLEIFDFYLLVHSSQHHGEDAWHTLVHVCKKWRRIVFASPRRLRLQLLCTNKRPIQNTLDMWPELPIVIKGRSTMPEPRYADSIIAALKQYNRVCQIDVGFIPNTFLKKIRAMEMRDPFPALTSLLIASQNHDAPALPDSFLGGSAPRLQNLTLHGISFPRLPNLLSSTRDLVDLRIVDIPPSGYISSEAVVTCLSALTRLQTLRLKFRSPRSQAHRENRLLPRLARFVLPALTKFEFRGDSEYLEDIAAQIDTPQLDRLEMTFFNQLIYDTPLLCHFISRTTSLKLPQQAKMTFSNYDASFDVARQDGNNNWGPSVLSSSILCRPLDWQLSSLLQICDSAFPLPSFDRLEVSSSRRYWEDDMDDTQWLEVLTPFTSVKDLVLCGDLTQLVALALEDLAWERVTEVLPALENLFLWGPQPSTDAIGRFIAMRRLSSHPIIVHHKETWNHDYTLWEVGNDS